MHPWRRHALRDGDAEAGSEPTEDRSDVLSIQGTFSMHREEWRVRRRPPMTSSTTFGEVDFDNLRHFRAERHETVFPELRLSDEEEIPLLIDVLDEEAAHLAHTKTQTIEDGKDHSVGLPSSLTSTNVGEPRDQFEKPTGLLWCEDEGGSLGASTAGTVLDRGPVHDVVRDEPAEKTVHDAKKVVEAARTSTRSRREERFDDLRGNRLHLPHLPLDKKPIK